MTLDGTVTRPGPDAGIDLSIQVRAVPVNEPLMAALEPGLRETIRSFFSRETARRLASADRSVQGRGNGFEPGGRLNGEVRVKRDTAVRPKSWIELDLDAEDLRLMMEAFPYPLQVRSGWLRVDAERVVVDDVVATGPSGGAGTIRGVIGLPPEMHLPPRIDLRLVGVDLPIDAYLLRALGEVDPEAERWLRELGVRGRVTGGGLIGSAAGPGDARAQPGGPPAGPVSPPLAETPEEDRLELALDLGLADGRIELWGGDVVLRRAEAEVRVSRDALRIDRVSADYPDGGRLGVEGWVGLTGGGLRLLIDAQRLGLGERVAMLIPAKLAAREATLDLLRRYQLGGVADAEVLLRMAPNAPSEPHTASTDKVAPDAAPDADAAAARCAELAWEVRVRPKALRGVYDVRPVRLDGVTGRVDIRPDGVHLRELAGRNGLSAEGAEGAEPAEDPEAAGRRRRWWCPATSRSTRPSRRSWRSWPAGLRPTRCSGRSRPRACATRWRRWR